MNNFGRIFNEERKAQGFESQAQLDAFYRERDHAATCSICGNVGGYVELSDGMQPVMGQCDIGKQLYRDYRKLKQEQKP